MMQDTNEFNLQLRISTALAAFCKIANVRMQLHTQINMTVSTTIYYTLTYVCQRSLIGNL